MSCTIHHRFSRSATLLASLRSHPTTTTMPRLLRPTTHPTLPTTACSLSLHQPRPAHLINPHHRTFSTTPPYHAQRTIQQVKSRQRSGPFSARAAILFVIAGAGLIVYFRLEKRRMDRKRIAEASKGVGKPKIGGEFTLVDQEGETFTNADMKGGFSLVYFGFTHCPDICPEELDKLSKIIDLVASTSASRYSIATSAFHHPSESASPRQPMLPLFVTCDPVRDTPGVLKSYLQEFHPGIVGLTGTWEQVRDMCKKYRVYFSTPEGVKPGEDYLVDHSIYFYLMDPEGDFVEAIGREHSAERAAQVIVEHMSDWRDGKRIQ